MNNDRIEEVKEVEVVNGEAVEARQGEEETNVRLRTGIKAGWQMRWQMR